MICVWWWDHYGAGFFNTISLIVFLRVTQYTDSRSVLNSVCTNCDWDVLERKILNWSIQRIHLYDLLKREQCQLLTRNHTVHPKLVWWSLPKTFLAHGPLSATFYLVKLLFLRSIVNLQAQLYVKTELGMALSHSCSYFCSTFWKKKKKLIRGWGCSNIIVRACVNHREKLSSPIGPC